MPHHIHQGGGALDIHQTCVGHLFGFFRQIDRDAPCHLKRQIVQVADLDGQFQLQILWHRLHDPSGVLCLEAAEHDGFHVHRLFLDQVIDLAPGEVVQEGKRIGRDHLGMGDFLRDQEQICLAQGFGQLFDLRCIFLAYRFFDFLIPFPAHMFHYRLPGNFRAHAMNQGV